MKKKAEKGGGFLYESLVRKGHLRKENNGVRRAM